MVIEIVVKHSTATMPEALTVWHGLDGTQENLSDQIAAMLGAASVRFTSSVTHSVDPIWRQYDVSTGVQTDAGLLQSDWNLNGTGASAFLADQTAVVINFKTGVSYPGRIREVQGRKFFPGIATGAGSGEPSSATLSSIVDAIQEEILDAGTDSFRIWSRTLGQLIPVASMVGKTEYGVQRRRRT